MAARGHTLTSPQNAMGTAFSTAEAAAPAGAASFDDLHEELLANIVSYLPARDVEALTVASKTIAFDVLPRFPVWKQLFCHRWSTLNYELEESDGCGPCEIEIDERVRAMFPPNCSESRIYQLLAHAITPVPSFADIRQTERARHFSVANHNVEAIGDPHRKRTLDIAYGGRQLGGDRCVRANVPFAPTFRVAVYAITDSQPKKKRFRVGVVASGYFEITIRKHRDPPPPPTNLRGMGRWRQLWFQPSGEMSAIGLATSEFPLVSRQPGWRSDSIGYHGDDGHLFIRSERGRAFATPFGPGDTVGCGIRRDLRTGRSFAYFTNNGDIIPNGDRQIECEHDAWYPVVGLDSFDAIHFNFGQEPFACAGAVDALFQEGVGQADILASQMSWYEISDSDGESTTSGGSRRSSMDSVASVGSGMRNHGSDEDEDGDFEMMYDQLSEMSEFAEFLEEFAEDMGMISDD